jgi:hypothetical protein
MKARWLLAGVLACLLAWPAAGQERVGAASLIETGAYRTPPDASLQELELRDSVFFNDALSTEPDGALRVTFIDGSVFNVGPGSEAVIDRFVFVPGGNENGLAVSASQGMFRFASGLMPDEAIEIRTPTATLGVRGTVLGFWVAPAVGVLVRAVAGTTLVEVGGEVIALVPGQFAYIDPQGNVTVGTVDGAIRPLLEQFGFPLGPDQLGTFFRFLGSRSLVRYADIVDLAEFPENWWRSQCAGWLEGDGAASDELDAEFAGACSGAPGQPDEDEPLTDPPPEEEDYEEEEYVECEEECE